MGALFELSDTAVPARNPDRDDPRLAFEVGAWICFEGRVRRHNDGREVLSLEYSAYQELAVKEGQKVVEEALERFSLLSVQAVHRVGLLALGDVALAVEVGAAHREEAFAACRWIVDQIKERVPIWKKERYREGDTTWVRPSEKP